MSVLTAETFDVYSTVDEMRQGVYGLVTSGELVVVPGSDRKWFTLGDAFVGTLEARRVIAPSEQLGIGVFFHVYLDAYEPDAYARRIVLSNGSNTNRVGIAFSASGQVLLLDGNLAVIASSASGVVPAQTDTSIQFQVNFSSGYFECRVNRTTVLSGTYAQITGATFGVSQLRLLHNNSASVHYRMYVSDIVTYTLSGANSDWPVMSRVIALSPTDDSALSQFTPRPIAKFGLVLSTSGGALRVADAAALEFGSADFTAETFVRFSGLPTLSAFHVIMGKATDSGQWSWALGVSGPDAGGQLQFRTSSNGTTISTLGVAFAFKTGRWYHVVASRTGGTVRLFVDGTQVASGAVGALFNGTAGFTVGGLYNGATALPAYNANAHFDETRITTGTGRYTGPYSVPATELPRSGADPHWSNVTFLSSFNTGTLNEGTAGAAELLGTAAVVDAQDNDAAYKTVRDANDNTFVEASTVGAVSEFYIEKLPVEVSSVRAVVVQARISTQEGVGSLKVGASVGGTPNMSAAVAANSAPTTAMHVVEANPATGGGLTVSTVNNMLLRIERAS